MNRIVAAITLFAAYLLTSVVNAASPIWDCGAVLKKPGRYKLENDLLSCSGSVSFGAITIASSDVRLNLKGHKITCSKTDGVTDVGILVQPGLSGVRIMHGEVSECDLGIQMTDISQSRVHRMTLLEHLPDPVTGGGFGLRIDAGDNNQISNNQFSGNLLGLFLRDASNNTVAGNIVTDSLTSGIAVFATGDVSNDNRVINNVSVRNGNGGIAIVGSASGNRVIGNITNENGLAGIGLISVSPSLPIPTANKVRGNIALDNGQTDLLEARVDFSVGFPPDFIVEEPCRNSWEHNNFMSQIGPDMCIGQP